MPRQVSRAFVVLVGSIALAVGATAVPAAADGQVATATALQTTNGCVAGSGQNCATFAGDPLSLDITVTSTDGTVPTGTVTIFDSTVWGATGNPVGSVQLDSNGFARYDGPGLPAGQHFVHATYAGDATHALSASYVLLVAVELNYDAVYLNWSPNPFQAGQAVTYTTSVSGNIWGSPPTGTMTLYDQLTFLGTATLVPDTGTFATTSRATIVATVMTAGTHFIYVDYSGDALFESNMSTSTASTVNPATPSVNLGASSPSSVVGQPVSLTATLASAAGPTGSITFTDGGVTLGTAAVSGGQATLTTSSLGVGAHTISAAYSGDANNAPATSAALTQSVTQATPGVSVTSPNTTSSAGQSVTINASVSGGFATSGSVTFSDGAATLAVVPLSSGQAAFTTSSLAVGTHNVVATYSGDVNNTAATSSALVLTVVPALTTTTLSTAQNPDQYLSPTTVTATVTSAGPAPTGTVTFYDGSTALGTAAVDISGHATLSIQNLSIGAHSLTATYSGDVNSQASGAQALSQVVTKDATTTIVTSSAASVQHGKPVTFTATVTCAFTAVTGTVTFYDGTNAIGTVNLVNGVAKLTKSNLSTGLHNITARYAGNTTQTGSTSPSVAVTVTH